MYAGILLFLLFCYAKAAKEKIEGWVLNSPEYYCDDKCRYELYSPSAKSNFTGCIDNDPLALSKTRQAQIGKCIREKNGLKQLTTTGVPRKDYRMSCRPAKDRMGWYRGWQSLTFHGKPCIRWDDAPVKFPLESFSNVSSPSVDYTTLKVFSTTISQHEDYCRNPDDHPYGPWCFYWDEKEIRRAPCFHTCVTDIKQLCLAKAFFPFYQTPYLLDGAPISPVDPHLLRTIPDKRLKALNERLDLSDILDVPDVIHSIGQVTPLYSITLTTRHLTQARLAGNAVVVRKKCHQTGIRTLIAGPWTPIKDDSLEFPEDSEARPQSSEILRDFLRVQFLAGRQGIDKPWKPCFTACEDNTITCWPNQTAKELSRRLFYFGNRVINRHERMCLKWTEALSILYKHHAKYLALKQAKTKHTPEKLKTLPPKKTKTPPRKKPKTAPPRQTRTRPPEKWKTAPPKKPRTRPPEKPTAPLKKPRTRPPEKPTAPLKKTRTRPPEKPKTAPPKKTKTRPPEKPKIAPPKKTETRPSAKPKIAPPKNTETRPPAKPKIAPPKNTSILFPKKPKRLSKSKEKKQKKQTTEASSQEIDDPDLMLQVFYYEELGRRHAVKGRMGLNRFLDGGGRLLHSSVCLDLARLIERDENSAPKEKGDYQPMLEEAYNSMYAEGPGCFSWADKNKVYVKYVPCFHPCPCGSEAMKAPFKPYREMCEKKNHEYEPCTARRDSRTLLLRRHDDKVKPLPEAEVRGLYFPLMMTMASAVVCLCISFFDQILGVFGVFRRN